MRLRWRIVILALACWRSAAAIADPLDSLETLGYQPLSVVSGRLRIAGSTTLEQPAALWAEGFTAVHPDVGVSIEAVGSDAGWKALVEGRADFAMLSRPVSAEERKTFDDAGERRLVVVPAAFERLVWIVNKANSVAELRWSPDSGVVTRGDTAGPDVAAITWGSLGGEGPQAAVPLRVHATELGSGTRWHLDRLLTGTASSPSITVREHPSIKAVAEAVANDPGGLGLIGENDGVWPGVRPLPLAIPAEAAAVADAVPGSERTPDCRPLFVAIAVPKMGEWPARIREFVSYIHSWQGQLDVAQDGLLPLTRAEIHAQREILDGPLER